MNSRNRKLEFVITLATVIFSQMAASSRAVERPSEKAPPTKEPFVLQSEARDESTPVVTASTPIPTDAKPTVKILADAELPKLPFVGVDTERGDRIKHNLLRAPIHLILRRPDG